MADPTAIQLSVRNEMIALVQLAIPSCIYFLSFFGLSTIELVVAGHLGTVEMTAVAFSQIILDFTIIVFTEGFSKGVHSLASQAYGAKNFVLLGRYAQLGCFMLTLVCLPIGILWWYIGDLLAHFGVAQAIVVFVKRYTRYSIIWAWPRIIYQLAVVYFASQQNVLPASLFSFVFVGVNALLNYILVFGISSWGWIGMGFIGMPIAMTIMMYTRLVAFLLYMMWYKQYHRKTWVWSLAFLNWPNLKVLTRVGLPIAVGQVCENAQLQSMALMASTLGDVALDSHNSMLYLFLLLTSPICGLGTGGTVRIGMYLGAGKPREAKFVWSLLTWGNLVVAFVLAIPLMLARTYIGHLFSLDPKVWEAMSEISTLAAVGYVVLSLFYSSMTTLLAQARSIPILGKEFRCFLPDFVYEVSFLCGAWIAGVPTAYLLGLKLQMGLLGIWIGMSTGYGVTTAIALYTCATTDWKKEAQRAVQRSRENCIPEEAESLL